MAARESTAHPVASSTSPPLRLWPGVLLTACLVLWRFGLPLVNSTWSFAAIIGTLVISALIVLWWLFFSRAPWVDRLLGLAAMALSSLIVPLFLHETMAQAGYGMLFRMYSIPAMCGALALAAWAFASFPALGRRVGIAAAIFAACGVWALLRFNGADGAFAADLAPRWSPTAEERLLAGGDAEPSALPDLREADLIDTAGGWPGFRGAQRDGRVTGVKVATDWNSSPPQERWRRAVGPGWSSMSVRGDLLYTQEQRGEEEVVAAYRVSDGEPVWLHSDAVRFWEAIGGAGPRGTPTPHRDQLFALGATGILNALDAETGQLQWRRNTVEDTGATIPGWGISGSPLVFSDTVYVSVSSAMAAYSTADGELLWKVADTGEAYSSPHLRRATEGDQILLLGSNGLRAFAPDDGRVLFAHEWSGAPIVQPALVEGGDLLIATRDRGGLRRLAVRQQPTGGWQLEERWTSLRLKPYFNDFVVHQGHAYGFDGRILACIDLETGERVWKGGRYGNGQLVLLADQDALLVLSEDGELALVSATSDAFRELAKVPAIEGKTWNHPVVAGQLLLVRNGEEMAAFDLPRKS